MSYLDKKSVLGTLLFLQWHTGLIIMSFEISELDNLVTLMWAVMVDSASSSKYMYMYMHKVHLKSVHIEKDICFSE